MSMFVEVAAGELIDKITILEIKLENMRDAAKLANVKREYDVLMDVYRREVQETPELLDMTRRLKQINKTLWDIEDSIRELDRRGEFGEEFVKLAKLVYRSNDARAGAKRDINTLLGSRIIEEKSYSAY
ncbi:DUF6165 family protein [Xanthobacteraceae bacterium Astr-EGSB]|uniref:DUF6165 family protein n=1 Tax=Astrobacterium formosum TaxID=3069710 RepID=UPI0027B5B3F6|nr:DUF6165 family protein [Xanthobacteraceae bacterium Astr-EGSB]